MLRWLVLVVMVGAVLRRAASRIVVWDGGPRFRTATGIATLPLSVSVWDGTRCCLGWFELSWFPDDVAMGGG